jgi:two-component system, NarL family, response regulator NreC
MPSVAGGRRPDWAGWFSAVDSQVFVEVSRRPEPYGDGMKANLHLATALNGDASTEQELAPIRVVLADDHALVRRSLRLLLDSEDGVDVVAEACDIATVLRHVHGHAPHVLVLDLQAPGGSSIEAIRRLHELLPNLAIIVLTMEPSPAFAQRALDSGAVGFVLKDRADTELPAAVRRVMQGEEYVSPRIAAGLSARRRVVEGDGLSPRETEILRLIALGHTSSEIACMIHLSRRTVETHRASIHSKLGLSTRAQLVDLALRRHLIGA